MFDTPAYIYMYSHVWYACIYACIYIYCTMYIRTTRLYRLNILYNNKVMYTHVCYDCIYIRAQTIRHACCGCIYHVYTHSNTVCMLLNILYILTYALLYVCYLLYILLYVCYSVYVTDVLLCVYTYVYCIYCIY